MEIICHSKFNVYQMWPDTIVVGDLNTPLSSVDRLSRLKKKNQQRYLRTKQYHEMDIRDVCRVFHSTAKYYIFFPGEE
jgi:hypothetical protein